MYQTIEAKLDCGRIFPLEKQTLPEHAVVLVTILRKQQEIENYHEKTHRIFNETSGIMNSEIDASDWQRKTRADDWSSK